VILCPARFDPTFSLRPWGARSLAPLFPAKTNLADPIGEAWMTGNESRFVDGPFADRTLGEVWPTMPAEWAGTDADRNAAFPLLVKFIFAEEKLSVQVHPNDAYAAQHENGGRGKTEMWYILRAQPGAEVLAGLKPDVTRDSFRGMIENGTAENALVHLPLRAGDAVFVPAGTAHTIGAGLMLCEIQEQSDTTYRVYDYNRRDAQGHSRELHVEKALEARARPPRRRRQNFLHRLRSLRHREVGIHPRRPRHHLARPLRAPDFPRRRRRNPLAR
jgi:mannose-6-phosphate isomerase